MEKIEAKAKKLAEKLHAGQKRKDGKKPYIVHPIAVAERVKNFSYDPEIIAAAYLHDTIEDTGITKDIIEKEFGRRVADLVWTLTSDEEQKKRKGKGPYLAEKINQMNLDARLIKLVDREMNISDLVEADAQFQKIYAEETRYILDHLIFLPTAIEDLLIKSIRQKIGTFLK